MVNLINLAIKGYDVIIGMDLLVQYHTRLDCRTKVVEFCILGEATLRLDVRDISASYAIISEIWVRKLLSKEAQGHPVFLVSTPGDKVKLKDVPVINEYPNIFSN